MTLAMPDPRVHRQPAPEVENGRWIQRRAQRRDIDVVRDHEPERRASDLRRLADFAE